jgi:hypothetical protein
MSFNQERDGFRNNNNPRKKNIQATHDRKPPRIPTNSQVRDRIPSPKIPWTTTLSPESGREIGNILLPIPPAKIVIPPASIILITDFPRETIRGSWMGL